jgi:DNA-directed RNA polymerase specialized sigma subunit
MLKEEISKGEMKKAEGFLEGYKTNKNLYKIDMYEKSRGLVSEWDVESPNELFLARARMFDVRHAIMGLPNCDEKLFLYFHYIKGESVERCGDMLGVSRATAFRLKKRAVEFFARQGGGIG